MQRATFLLLLALAAPAFGGPVSTSPLFPTQENFTNEKFQGKWYDIAMGTPIPMFRLHKDERSMGTWEFRLGDNNMVNMTLTTIRNGVCSAMSSVLELTGTPGRVIQHFNSGGVMDSYVVHTNYDEYATVVVVYGSEKKSLAFKLFGRSMELRPTLITEFSELVKELSKGTASVFLHQKREKCTVGEIALEPEFQRVKRDAVLPTPAEEGSGDDTPVFWNAGFCQLAPDAGPCFGMMQRYYYNSTLMACLPFNFGGCLGNQNKFLTEKECLQSCRTEAACRLPVDPGTCKGNIELWAFDSAAGKCVSFKYGGCKGNGNKFYSQKECDEYCGVVKDGDE